MSYPNPPEGEPQPAQPQPAGDMPPPAPANDTPTVPRPATGQPSYPSPFPPANYPTAYQNAPGFPRYPQAGEAPRIVPVKPRRTNNLITRLVALLVIIVASAIIGTLVLRGAGANTSATAAAYTAAKPGPGCDTGAGMWEALDTSQISGRCQSDGLLITRTGSADRVGEVYFDGTNSSFSSFPTSYQVQIDATIESGDTFAGVGIDVHRQLPVGGQVFFARANGQWSALHIDPQGNVSQQLAIGFLAKPTKTMHLVVTVAGPTLTFSINGQQVTQVVDSAYATTHVIGLALSDPQSTVPPSALLANFAYTPQPNPTLANADAEATATATVQSAIQSPYHAAVPGPGCDTQGGQWAAPAAFGDTTTAIQCAASGLRVTEAAKSQNLGAVLFFNRAGQFTPNYRVGAQITVAQLHHGCAGIITRGSSQSGANYVALICDNGAWAIFVNDSAGNPSVLARGIVARKATYLIAASTDGATQSLSIDGHTVGHATDTTVTTTDFVALVVVPGQQTLATTATFANFTLTPLAS
jgi:hypothetical protein